ncbi:MAG: YHS domain-containing protein [Verrucomicrobia bacterium]|nr:YHS domain-containing protein [Verrucomicrobiota bacterium]
MQRFSITALACLFGAVTFLPAANLLSAPQPGTPSTPGFSGLAGAPAVFLEDEENTAVKQNLDSQGVILKGVDAVAYFRERKPVNGSSEFSSTYAGATYLFASAANKAEFDKDPAKFAPRYGGFCAYGVSLGVLADPEGPDAFLIYKGRLYICGNQGALKDFKKDIEGNVIKADGNWPTLAKP